MDYDCPACNKDQGLEPLRKEAAEGFVSILWGKCGHNIDLENLEKSVKEQQKIRSKFMERGVF